MSALVAVLGLVAGVCLVGSAWALWGIPLGWGRSEPDPERRRWRPRVDRLALRTVVAVAAAVAAGVATGWPVGVLLAGAGGFMLPSVGASQRARAQSLERIEAVAAWTEMLRDVLSAGGGLEQSIAVTAEVAPLPIADEVGRLANRIRGGQDLVEALLRLSAELDDEMADKVVAALVLAARRSPGHLSDLLSALAEIARDNLEMRRRIETRRTSVRSSVRLITIITAGFSAVVMLNRDYRLAYRSAVGQGVLVVVVALFVVAHRWVNRATEEGATDRVLSGVDPTMAATAPTAWMDR